MAYLYVVRKMVLEEIIVIFMCRLYPNLVITWDDSKWSVSYIVIEFRYSPSRPERLERDKITYKKRRHDIEWLGWYIL